MDFKLSYLSLILIIRHMTCDSSDETSSGSSVRKYDDDQIVNPRARPDVSHDDNWDPPISLCDDPVIYAIDRMNNGSVWIYRDRYYWQLNGLPSNETTLEGPFRIWWPGMSPVKPLTLVMTKTVGEDQETTFRFRHDMFWAFNRDGKLYIGAPNNNLGKKMEMPIGGLRAVLFNHYKTNPLMLGFRGLNVYYYRFQAMKWVIDGDPEGYIQGRYGENFPVGIEAALAFPAENDREGYIAYLFRSDKYCKRTDRLRGGKTCEEWKDNKELFGCDRKRDRKQDQVSEEPTADDGIDVWPPNFDDRNIFGIKSSKISNNSKSVEISLRISLEISVIWLLFQILLLN